MQNLGSPYNKLVLFFLIIMVWLWPCYPILAQSYWDAIFQLGYDPFTHQVSDRLACQRINKLYELRGRVSEHLEIDPELQNRMRNLHSRLTSLDAANLYDIMPYSDQARLGRGVGIRGGSNARKYRLGMYDPEINDWLSFAGRNYSRFNSSGVQLGDIDLRTFIKPERKNTFRLAADAQMYLAEIPAATVPRMMDGALKTLWLHAEGDIKSPTRVQEKTPLNRHSINVLNGLTRDFPGLIRVIFEYFTINNIISSEPDRVDESALVEIRAQFNQEAFAKDFPEIEKLLNELKDSVFFRTRLHDEQDRLMGIMELDSVDKTFTIQLRIREGRLLPLIAGTGDRHKNGFSFSVPGCKPFYIAYDIHLNIVGLRLNIESLSIALDYINRGHELEIKACLWQPPEIIDAGGWAFGFIPLWLVNALIPSNVEEITTNFFRTLALGNEGEGTRIQLESNGVREMKNYIHLQAGTEVLGNGTIKLAFSLQRKLLARQKALMKEIRAFKKRFIAAFYQDYRRMIAIRGCQ